MHSKQSLIEDLKNIGIKPNDTLLVHSSIKAIGEVDGGAETVLDALIEYLSDGLLILPTHTWMEVPKETDTYDPLKSLSCVGILTNLFLKREGVIRSLHPTHSIAAIGKKALEFTQGEENTHTPCSRNGCWGRLYDYEAKILFLGCSLTKNTFIHGVEEWNNIPDRINPNAKQLKIVTDAKNGKIIDCTYYGHHCTSTSDISGNYDKLEKPLLIKKIAVQGKIGDANSTLCDAVKMADLTGNFLERNPNLFVDKSEVPVEWYTTDKANVNLPPKVE